MTHTHCRAEDCGLPMVSSGYGQGMVPDGHVRHGGHGYCSKHYYRWRRHGDTSKTLRPVPGRRKKPGTIGRSREEVLEEYAMIRDEVDSVAQAAERMGMTYAALDRALYRARKAGIPGAVPPEAQIARTTRTFTYAY